MMLFKDQLQREIYFKKTPKRIISLVPSLTELLVDLGLENSIVGITKFCIHPSHLKQTKTIVGGTKNIKIDEIKALKPDIILCNKEENTQEIVEACKQITLVHISDIYTINDTLELIQQYGKLFSCKTEASNLIQKIQFKLDDFQQFIQKKKTLKIVYFIWRNPWMVTGNNTFINHLLALNKFDNIYQNKERYPEVELKNIKLKDNLDLVFFSSEPYPFKEKHILEIKNSTNAKTILVDGELFSWYGSRLLKAFEYFKILHNSI